MEKLINKIKENLLEFFGYIDITKIKIEEDFKKTKPKYRKMQEKKMFFAVTGKFMEPIIINQNNVLINGYTSYILANCNYYKYVKVKRVIV